MTNRITPPPELVDLIDTWAEAETAKKALKLRQQGADQELEACCQALYNRFASPGHQAQAVAQEMLDWLRATRRPSFPSDKELAQRILVENGVNLDGRMELDSDDIAILTRALKALPND